MINKNTGRTAGLFKYWKNLSVKGKGAIAVILLIIIAGAAYTIQTNKKAASTTTVSTVKVEKGTISVLITGSGPVTSSRELVIKSPGKGIIKDFDLKDGQAVEANEQILSMESPEIKALLADARDMENKMSELSYRAPFTAVVSALKISQGKKVRAESILFSLVDARKMILSIPAPEDSEILKDGTRISLTLLEYGEKLAGRILNSGAYSTVNGKRLLSYNVILDKGAVIQNDTLVAVEIPERGQVLSGMLQPGPSIEIDAPAEGTITALNVQNGDVVEEGTLIYVMDSPALQATYYTKSASLEGIVEGTGHEVNYFAPFPGIFIGAIQKTDTSTTFLKVGDEVNTGQNLGKIIAQDRVQISFTVDELDISKVQLGQKARITAGAVGGKVFDGEVIKISQDGVVQNGVAFYWVTVGIDQWEGLLLGMTADVEIVVAEKIDTLVLPITAVQDMRGKKYVLLKNGVGEKQPLQAGNGARQLPENAVPVEIGLHNENQVEILKGLAEGQEVQLPVIKRPLNSQTATPGAGGGLPIPGVRPPGR